MNKNTWNADHNRVAEALAPFVFTIDGDEYLNTDAPADLVRAHQGLTAIGYANGWL